MPAMLRRLIIVILLFLPATTLSAQGEAGDLLGRINGLRASLGLPGYNINGALSAAAQSQAQWMADTGSVSHNRPDGSGPRTRAVNAGYPTTDVSENIYGGSNASVDSAWSFWVNSGIHYRGLVNERYQEVGIGIATSSWGRTFVLVFGNPGGPPPFVPQAAASAGGSSAASAPPSYVVGTDPQGFIMHEIQPEDTLGDIALVYGYTWDDLPYMREVNNIEGNLLPIGGIFLVPPHDGTYTPTPGDAEAQEESSEPDEQPEATATPQPTTTLAPTQQAIATAAAMPEVIALNLVPPPSTTPTSATVAQTMPTPVMISGGSTITRSSGPSPWLMIALVLQVGLLFIAGFEFVRRTRRGR